MRQDAEIIPWANPEAMARRFVRGLNPISANSPASVPGRAGLLAPVSRPALASERRQQSDHSLLSDDRGLDEVGAWQPVWLAVIGVCGALWTLLRALGLAGRVSAARGRLIACKPVLVPLWWLCGYIAATGVSFLATMAIFLAAWH